MEAAHVERDLADDGEFLIANLGVDDAAHALVDSADDIALELGRRDDLDLHDGLEDDGCSLGEGLAESALRSETESKFGRIDLVGGSVLEDHLDTADLVTGEDTALESVVESLQTQARSGESFTI